MTTYSKYFRQVSFKRQKMLSNFFMLSVEKKNVNSLEFHEKRS